MIHAAIFKTTDPACRTSLVISGSASLIALNTPAGGCWRPVPPGCASVADVPPLGELPPNEPSPPPIPAKAGKSAEAQSQS